MNLAVTVLVSGGAAATAYFIWDLVALFSTGGQIGSSSSLIGLFIAVVALAVGAAVKKSRKIKVNSGSLFLYAILIFLAIEAATLISIIHPI